MTPYALDLTGVVVAVGGPLAALFVWWLVSRRPSAPEPEATRVVSTGWRYCPREHRVRAAILHADGSATCADTECGAHIPSTEEVPHG
jgi:hypothetical protein